MSRQFSPSPLPWAGGVILLGLFAWAFLLYPGFFQSHSGLLPIYDAVGGSADVTSLLSPRPTYLVPPSPLAAWLVVGLSRVGVSPLIAVKAIYLLSFVLAGLALWLYARRHLGEAGAMVAALVYTYAPFHLATVYVRGSPDEALAFAFLPLISWSCDRWLFDQRLWGLILAGGGLILLVLADSPLGITAVLLSVLYVGTLYRQHPPPSHPRRVFPWVLSVMISLAALLVAIALAMRLGTNNAGAIAAPEHLVYPYQFFSPGWGWGQSLPGWQETFPVQIGLISIAFTLVALLRFLWPNSPLRWSPILSVHLIFAGLLLWLSSTLSFPLWQRGLAEVLRLVFPWQLLIPVTLNLALLAGAIVPAWPSLRTWPLFPALLGTILLASYPYLAPRPLPPSAIPEPVHSPLARFDEGALLLAAQASPEVQAGTPLTVTLVWQNLEGFSQSQTVFVHLVAPGGERRGQGDALPVQGTRPTTGWLPGEVIVDTHTIEIPADTPPAQGYIVQIGLYQLETGRRIPVRLVINSAERPDSMTDHVAVGPISIINAAKN